MRNSGLRRRIQVRDGRCNSKEDSRFQVFESKAAERARLERGLL